MGIAKCRLLLHFCDSGMGHGHHNSIVGAPKMTVPEFVGEVQPSTTALAVPKFNQVKSLSMQNGRHGEALAEILWITTTPSRLL